MRLALILAALLLAGTALAATMTPQIGGGISQFDGGIAKQGAVSGGGGGGGCILADTGNNLLADTGNCILVQ